MDSILYSFGQILTIVYMINDVAVQNQQNTACSCRKVKIVFDCQLLHNQIPRSVWKFDKLENYLDQSIYRTKDPVASKMVLSRIWPLCAVTLA